MFKGFYHGETESGLARILSPRADGRIVFVPIDRTSRFRKVAVKNPEKDGAVSLKEWKPGGKPCHCIFDVEGWLKNKDDMKGFDEAVFGKDYV